MADVVRFMPGVTMAQGEGNRDTPVFRGNASTADFFVDGVRDDVQYFRDVYNVERVEALKGPNAMIFGRGGAGGVINRVTRQADWGQPREVSLQMGSWDNRRMTADLGTAFNSAVAGQDHRDVRELGVLSRRRRRSNATACSRPSRFVSVRRQRCARATSTSMTSGLRTAAFRPSVVCRSRPTRPRSLVIPTRAPPTPRSMCLPRRSSISWDSGATLRNRAQLRRLRQVLPERLSGRREQRPARW